MATEQIDLDIVSPQVSSAWLEAQAWRKEYEALKEKQWRENHPSLVIPSQQIQSTPEVAEIRESHREVGHRNYSVGTPINILGRLLFNSARFASLARRGMPVEIPKPPTYIRPQPLPNRGMRQSFGAGKNGSLAAINHDGAAVVTLDPTLAEATI